MWFYEFIEIYHFEEKYYLSLILITISLDFQMNNEINSITNLNGSTIFE